MSQSVKKWLSIAFGVQVLWSLPVGGFFLWRWLAFDDPDRSYACSGSSRNSVCTEGETTNMILGLVFGSIGVIFLVITVILLTGWWRRRARELFLRERGDRATGVVTEVSASNTRVNGRRVMRVSGEITGVPGGRFRHHTFHPVPPGTRLEVAYDPAGPGDAIVLDDLSKVAGDRFVLGSSSREDAILSRLSRLDELRRSGALTEEEFGRLKAQVLGEKP